MRAIAQGSLATRVKQRFYEPVEKEKANSIIIRANQLENEDEEVVIVDFSDSDKAQIYQGKARIDKHGLRYYTASIIRGKCPGLVGKAMYYRAEPKKWLNMPKDEDLNKPYTLVSKGISEAELVFIGYHVLQSKKTGRPLSKEVELWLRGKEPDKEPDTGPEARR